MPKGRTAYERIRDWVRGKPKEVPVEKQHFNPLGLLIGAHARFHDVMATVRGEPDVELDDELFKVVGLWVWRRNRHGDALPPMADYVLESGMKTVTVRVVDSGTGGSPQTLLLTQHWPESNDPHGWNDESPIVIEALNGDSAELVHNAGTENEQRFFRDLCNVHADVSVLRDLDRNGTVESNEVVRVPYSLWTYRRETDRAGTAYVQHLHVQLGGKYDEKTKLVDGGDKTILMLSGEDLDASDLMLY